MTLIFTFLMFLIGFFGGAVGSNNTVAQSQSGDILAKSDINSMHQKLEEFYNERGYYPTELQLEAQGSDLFPGIDEQALIDEAGNEFNVVGGLYTYVGLDCKPVSCQKYMVSAKLSDGTTYTKNSLN